MGIHSTTKARWFKLGSRRVVVAGILLLVVAALGVWLWQVRAGSDPFGADVVRASAIVVTSPACPAGTTTTVQLTAAGSSVLARLDGCGFTAGHRLVVEYAAGKPTVARLAGTGPVHPGLASLLLPFAIVIAGFTAVYVIVAQLLRRRGRRGSRGSSVAADTLLARFRPPPRP